MIKIMRACCFVHYEEDLVFSLGSQYAIEEFGVEEEKSESDSD
jgi:hypothetical protein